MSLYNIGWDNSGVFYNRVMEDEYLRGNQRNGIRMLAFDPEEKVWKATKKFFRSNEECFEKGLVRNNQTVYNFVVVQSNNSNDRFVLIGSKGHVALSNAAFSAIREIKVRYAGEVAFDMKGRVLWWDNSSGHYKPPRATLETNCPFPIEKFWDIQDQKQELEEYCKDGLHKTLPKRLIGISRKQIVHLSHKRFF